MDLALVKRLTGQIENGDTDAVYQALGAHIRSQPDDVTAWMIRASADMKLQRWRDAVSAATRTTEIDPTSSTGYYLRSVCYLCLANQEQGLLQALLVRRADVEVDHALMLSPESTTYQNWRKQLDQVMRKNEVVETPKTSGPASQVKPGWELAERIARVAGNFVKGAIG